MRGFNPELEWIVAFHLMLFICAMHAGCSTKPDADAPEGYMLGYDSYGIALVPLNNGSREYLLKNNTDHFYTNPLWDTKSKQLICVDSKQNRIVVWRKGGDHAETVFTIAAGSELQHMSFLPGQREIVFVLRDPRK